MGTVFGAVFFSIMGSIFASLGIFHPYALGMASGVGSASMMTAAATTVKELIPKDQQELFDWFADYIAYRYGRSHTIAVLVTLAAVVGSVPYIALQLKGITTGVEVIGLSTGAADAVSGNLSLYLALALALFAILFGTRNMDAS